MSGDRPRRERPVVGPLLVGPTIVPPTASVPPPAPTAFERWFAQWWVGYPRKVSKRSAQFAARRVVRCEEKAAAVDQGTAAWVDYWRRAGTELQFIPHPSTFLRERRWEVGPPPLRRRRPADALVALEEVLEADDLPPHHRQTLRKVAALLRGETGGGEAEERENRPTDEGSDR